MEIDGLPVISKFNRNGNIYEPKVIDGELYIPQLVLNRMMYLRIDSSLINAVVNNKKKVKHLRRRRHEK